MKKKRMLKSLYGKIALILFVLFLVIGLLNIFQTLMTTKLHIQEVDQRLNRSLAEYLASERDFFKNGRADVPELKRTFENLMHINPNIELYLLNPEGKILSYSAPPGKVKRESVDMAPLKKFMSGTDNLPIFGDDPRDPDGQKIFTVAPIHSDGLPKGYLYIILGGEEYDSVLQRLQRSYVLRLGLWITIGGVLFVFLMGLFLVNLLTRRIKVLSAALDSFKQRNFSSPIDFTGWHPKARGDEIDRLGNVTLQMSARIIDQINTIKQVDNLRRDMISDISHDLRTPLSSLQGHLETLLLKHGQLKEAEQAKYLQTAFKQSERLGRLIADLYELAKLDSPDIELNKEPFHLGELLQDILQKYQPAVEKKEVDLSAEFPKSLPLVHADIGLIERAIQNLIDNSLSHSRPGGNIILSIAPGANKLTVKVIDDGAGISKEDLPHIFERFYHGKNRKREADEDYSSGLGLAITKRILDLHKSTVKVKSEPDKRTVFTFYLPVFKA
jgi:two-component system OmpR family sensor kinase